MLLGPSMSTVVLKSGLWITALFIFLVMTLIM